MKYLFVGLSLSEGKFKCTFYKWFLVATFITRDVFFRRFLDSTIIIQERVNYAEAV